MKIPSIAFCPSLSRLAYRTWVKQRPPKVLRKFIRGLYPYHASKGVLFVIAFVGVYFV